MLNVHTFIEIHILCLLQVHNANLLFGQTVLNLHNFNILKPETSGKSVCFSACSVKSLNA